MKYRLFVVILFGSVCSSFSLDTEQSQALCNPVKIEDTTVLGEFFGPQIAFGPGECRACVYQKAPSLVMLFRNGTQLSLLDSTRSAAFLEKSPQVAEVMLPGDTLPKQTEREQRVSFSRELWGNEALLYHLFNPAESFGQKVTRILLAGAWNDGIGAGETFEIGGSTTQITRIATRVAGRATFFYLTAGVSYTKTAIGGGLPALLKQDNLNNFRNHAWSFSFGVPFLLYEWKQAAALFPEYFWLEENLYTVMDSADGGVTVAAMESRWNQGHLRNIAHHIHARAGYLEGLLVIDPDLYKIPLVQLRIEGLPAIFGTWGASLTKAADLWVPGVWVNLFPLAIPLYKSSNMSLPFELNPVRCYFNYWSIRRYYMGVSTSFNVDYRKKEGKQYGTDRKK